MLRTVYLKSLRDRLLGVSVAVLALFLTAWLGLWAYSGVEGADTYFASMPDAFVDLLGITRESGTAGLMMSMMFGFMGAFVLGGLAVSFGASVDRGRGTRRHHERAAHRRRARAPAFMRRRPRRISRLIVGACAASSASYWVAASS